MKMIKEGLRLAPSNIRPEYLLKMYYEGYNAALDDTKDVINAVKIAHLNLLEQPDVHPESNSKKLYCATIKSMCDNIIKNLCYKELPKK